VTCVSNGAFGEAWFASASLSAKLSSVSGFKAGKGGPGIVAGKGRFGIVAGDGVWISVRWMVAGSGAGGGCTAVEIG